MLHYVNMRSIVNFDGRGGLVRILPGPEQHRSPDTAGGPVLVTSALTKRYGDLLALNNLDLRLNPGEIYGLLGPNGSGKSTALRMITGILAPTSGSVRAGGYDVWKQPEKAKALMGYIPDEPVLYEKLTALEFLDFVGELYSVPKGQRKQKIETILHMLDMEGRINDQIQSYSRGMRQKVAITAALLHEPPVLIMDEPVTALDPIAVRVFRGMLRQKTKSGGAVLLSTHILEIAQHLCDRVGILVGGELVDEGTPSELRARAGSSSAGASLEDLFISLAASPEYKDIISSLEADLT